MNFFLQVVATVAFVRLVGGTDLQVNAPVSFGLSISDDLLDIITISAMVGIVVVPLLVGLIYAKVLISRLRDQMKKNPTDEEEVVESLSFPLDIGQNTFSLETRLSDMKTNAVLRLWWKKQHKIHGVSLIEADVEAQTRTLRSQTTDKSMASKESKKSDQSDKRSHSHHKEKGHGEKHHKHKKKKEEPASP